MYQRKKRRPVGEINVVPYIDVMLVLLIIFMATAPLITHGVKVDLPKMEESDLVDTKDTPPIIASIDAEGKYYVSIGTDPEAPMEALDVAAVIKLQLQKKSRYASNDQRFGQSFLSRSTAAYGLFEKRRCAVSGFND